MCPPTISENLSSSALRLWRIQTLFRTAASAGVLSVSFQNRGIICMKCLPRRSAGQTTEQIKFGGVFTKVRTHFRQATTDPPRRPPPLTLRQPRNIFPQFSFARPEFSIGKENVSVQFRPWSFKGAAGLPRGGWHSSPTPSRRAVSLWGGNFRRLKISFLASSCVDKVKELLWLTSKIIHILTASSQITIATSILL